MNNNQGTNREARGALIAKIAQSTQIRREAIDNSRRTTERAASNTFSDVYIENMPNEAHGSYELN